MLELFDLLNKVRIVNNLSKSWDNWWITGLVDLKIDALADLSALAPTLGINSINMKKRRDPQGISRTTDIKTDFYVLRLDNI